MSTSGEMWWGKKRRYPEGEQAVVLPIGGAIAEVVGGQGTFLSLLYLGDEKRAYDREIKHVMTC